MAFAHTDKKDLLKDLFICVQTVCFRIRITASIMGGQGKAMTPPWILKFNLLNFLIASDFEKKKIYM